MPKRTKPITRDEIRAGYNVETLPANSFRKSASGDLEPIPELWAPVLRELNLEHQKLHEEWVRMGISEGPCRPIKVPPPLEYWGKHYCRHCDRVFYKADKGPTQNGGVMRYCSDKCVAAAHRACMAGVVKAKAKAKARAAARANRKCATCGKPIKAQRSTMKFCSVRCRVAAHRAE
jgi:hypothetical protein